MDEQLWSLTCFLVFACLVKKSKTGFFYWSSIGFNLRCTIWLLDLPQQVWIFSCAFSFAIFLPLTVAHSWLLFFILLHCSVFRTSISIWLHILIKKHISLAGYNREKMSTSRHNQLAQNHPLSKSYREKQFLIWIELREFEEFRKWRKFKTIVLANGNWDKPC